MWKNIAAGTLTVVLGGGVAVDATSLNETPLRASYALTERVEVAQTGDTVRAELPWKDQQGLTIAYDMGKPSAAERIKDKRNKAVVTEQVSTDSMKIDIILNERPETNRFCYTIDGWEEYDFFYQPPLTQEEIAEGAYRPEEIVGSYAVYHKTLKNHKLGETNYETGKVAHIPYPYVWSVNDETTKHRAEAFSIDKGQMCVTVAEKDLDAMEYPIRVDPTFGYTSVGASAVNIAQRQSSTIYYTRRCGTAYTLSESGTLDSITAYLNTIGEPLNIDTYVSISVKDGSGSGSHTLVAGVETADKSYTATTPQWYEFAFDSELLSADDYILGLLGNGRDIGADSKYLNFYYDTDAGATGYQDGGSDEGSLYTSLRDESPWDIASSVTRLSSVYATYTATGGGSTSSTTTTPYKINGGSLRVQGGTVIIK